MEGTLVDAIRFKWLMARLSSREQLIFLQKMRDIGQIEWIALKAFNREQQRLSNETLRLIIQSREADTASASEATGHTWKLESLPLTLLGHAASFLNARAYNQMSRLSRVVFLSLNSPNKLVKMDISHLQMSRSNFSRRFLETALGRFASLESLSIDISACLYVSSANLPMLRELELHGQNASEAFEPEIDDLRQMGKMSGLSKLKLCRFGMQTWFSANSVYWLLTPFESVKEIEIINIMLADAIEENMMQSLLPNVEKLTIRATEFEDGGHGAGRNSRFVKYLAGSLRYLHLDYSSRTDDVNFDNYAAHYPNLEHLRLDAVSCSGPIYHAITKDAPKLFHLIINPYPHTTAEPLLRDDQECFATVICNLMTTIPKLQHFELSVSTDDWREVICRVEDGLFGTFKTKRDLFIMKITLLWTTDRQIDSRDAIKSLCKFMTWQHASGSKSSAFYLDMQDIGEERLFEDNRTVYKDECTLEDLNNMFPKVFAHRRGALFSSIKLDSQHMYTSTANALKNSGKLQK